MLRDDGSGKPVELEKRGGVMDGEIFTLWLVDMDSGKTFNCWKSNVRPGYYRSALVPLEMPMEEIIFL